MLLNLVLRFLNSLRNWKYNITLEYRVIYVTICHSNICYSVSINSRINLWNLRSRDRICDLWFCLSKIYSLKILVLSLSQNLWILISVLVIYCRRCQITIYSFSLLLTCHDFRVFFRILLLLNIALSCWLIPIVVPYFFRFYLIIINLTRITCLILIRKLNLRLLLLLIS
jgi:hypothetical protein